VLQDVLGSGSDETVQSVQSEGLDMAEKAQYIEIIATQARTILMLVKSNIEKDAEITRLRAALDRRTK
jgi:hypothetical protein